MRKHHFRFPQKSDKFMQHSTSHQINFHFDLRCFILLRCSIDFRCLNLGASISCKLFTARTRSAGGHIAQFFSKPLHHFIAQNFFFICTNFTQLHGILHFSSYLQIITIWIGKELIKYIFMSEHLKKFGCLLASSAQK